MTKWLLLASIGVLAACTQPQEPYRGTTITSSPAIRASGSEGAESGQRSMMGAPASGIVSAPAANPTGSAGAQSGQRSNMGAPASGFVSAPASGPVSNESPNAGQPSMMLRPGQRY
jgi:hypothetical protein